MWTKIIDSLWREQNEIKQGNTRVHDEREVENLNDRTQWYVILQHKVVSYGDLFIAKIDVNTLPTMTMATKRQWLQHLIQGFLTKDWIEALIRQRVPL